MDLRAQQIEQLSDEQIVECMKVRVRRIGRAYFEIGKMRLFLRYQTTVQREFDKAMAEYTKLQAERAEEPFEETIPEAATQPTPIRVNPCESVANFPAAVGFASQPFTDAATPRYTGL